MSVVSSPIHRICPHPNSPIFYLAVSNSVHKYNTRSSTIDATYTPSTVEAYPQFLEIGGDWLFISGGDKYLRVLNAHSLESVAEFVLLKRASTIYYDQDASAVIVADRTGEVFSFPWPLDPSSKEKYDKLKSLPPIDEKKPVTKATDERFLGTYLLGHSSSVIALTVAKTAWGNLLVTGDRDEHVWFSVFPQTWVIHAMGLSHTAFVTCTTPVPNGALTGGGDNRVIHWDFNGVILAEYTISQGTCVRCIYPFNESVIVAGDGSSAVEVLRLDGLIAVQKIDVSAPVLDIAIQGDVMYISLNAHEGNWIEEYSHENGVWSKSDTDRWRIANREETVVDLNWLESMRKKIGHQEDD